MLTCVRNRVTRFAGIVAAIGLTIAPALATDLPPGDTLEPVPVASMPSGATLEATYTRDYDITWTQFPFVRHVTGTVTQGVYRMPDNTLIFRYHVSNDSDSDGAITRFAASNYSVFNTDVWLASSTFCFNCENADRATRDIFGTGVSFDYDLGIPTGFSSRAMVIRTDATSYRVSNGRLQPLGAGRVTLQSGRFFVRMFGFAYPVVDSTPPVATITSPSSIGHSCPPVTITGRAFDTAGFDSYKLEYATLASGPWTLIDEFEEPVTLEGTLGVWNADVPEGYYFVRLTALNTAELSTVVTTVVYVDRNMSPVVVRSPIDTQVLGGTVCFDGTVWDTGGSSYEIEYRALPGGSFADVVPGTPTYPGQIITDGLGSWNTSGGPTAVADGSYQVRVRGTDGCDNTSAVTRDIVVDNTAPIAFITSPVGCAYARGVVNIVGTVADTHLAGWSLSYTGGDATGWVTIASGAGPVTNATLGTWDTTGLRNCAYTLWLHAGDSSSISCGATTNQTSHYISVNVGCENDFNRDGISNSQDFFDFLTAFFTPCI